jgi:hypothetical protein
MADWAAVETSRVLRRYEIGNRSFPVAAAEPASAAVYPIRKSSLLLSPSSPSHVYIRIVV